VTFKIYINGSTQLGSFHIHFFRAMFMSC